MLRIMQGHLLDRALLLLQQLAYARVLCEFDRLQRLRCSAADVSVPPVRHAIDRLAVCESRLARFQVCIDEPEKLAAVRVARALYLRFLLHSAPVRLQPWSDSDDLFHMPPSHMFEWVAHDLEHLELAALEDAMSPAEAAAYARSLDTIH